MSEHRNDTGSESEVRINFFRPVPGYMRREVLLIWFLLGAWALLTFGFQFIVTLTAQTGTGEGPLTAHSWFDFPFHILYTGQILVLGFIWICYVFNSALDRLTRHFTRKH